MNLGPEEYLFGFFLAGSSFVVWSVTAVLSVYKPRVETSGSF